MYRKCMSRTNIDIDEDACRVVMRRYHFATKRDAVNFAFRTTAGEPLERLTMPGSSEGQGGTATSKRCGPAGQRDPRTTGGCDAR